ncbi:MAG: ATP-binding protein, partial [Cyanobacteria bacterium P01_A01_bin.135]
TVRVQDCEPGGLLGSITRIDLFALDEAEARQAILNAPLKRVKPDSPPPFPLGNETQEKPDSPPPFPAAKGDRSSLVIPPNPFVPTSGLIDQAHQFFGREKELRNVFDILNSGSSVAVIGERQVGKSSLLKAIAREASSRLHQPRRPVYLNLQDVYDEADFYEALCEELRVEVSRGRQLARAVRRMEPKVLLLLDELEKMAWDGFTGQIRSQLRGLAEGGDAPLRLVISASVPLGELFSDSHGNVSPLRNICLEEPLGPWDE